MAIADNDLWLGGDPDYDELSINTNPMPGEAHLRKVCSKIELDLLDALYSTMVTACQKSEQHFDKYNRGDPELITNASSSNNEYQFYRESLFDKHPEIDADRKRGEFDPTPPGRVGQVLGPSTMFASAAMGMLDDMRSGYYSGVEKLNTVEKVYGLAGARSTLDLRFIAEWTRRRCLHFFSYDHDINDLRLGMRAIHNIDPLYCEAVFVDRDTTIQRAQELLMGLPFDGALYLTDEQGRLERIITRSDVGLDAKGKISNGELPRTVGKLKLIPREQIITAKMGVTREQARDLMDKNRDLKRLPILDEEGRVRYSLSRLQCHYAHHMADYFPGKKLQKNIGVAIGITNKDDMIARIDAAIEEGATMITLETAHAFRRDVIRKFKQDFLPQMAKSMSAEDPVAYLRAHKNDIRELVQYIKSKAKNRPILIGFGTVTSPEAVRLLAALGVDVVKVGVGGGGQCTTFDATGVGGPPFGYVWRCGRAAAALGIQIMADGQIHNRRRVGLVSSIHGVGLLQMGSWPGDTVEAASPPMYKEGVWVRKKYGEASLEKHVIKQAKRDVDVEEEDKLVHHSEGQVVLAPIATGQFATVGGIALGSVQSQASDASYSNAHTTDEYQQSSRIRRITKTPTKLV